MYGGQTGGGGGGFYGDGVFCDDPYGDASGYNYEAQQARNEADRALDQADEAMRMARDASNRADAAEGKLRAMRESGEIGGGNPHAVNYLLDQNVERVKEIDEARMDIVGHRACLDLHEQKINKIEKSIAKLDAKLGVTNYNVKRISRRMKAFFDSLAEAPENDTLLDGTREKILKRKHEAPANNGSVFVGDAKKLGQAILGTLYGVMWSGGCTPQMFSQAHAELQGCASMQKKAFQEFFDFKDGRSIAKPEMNDKFDGDANDFLADYAENGYFVLNHPAAMQRMFTKRNMGLLENYLAEASMTSEEGNERPIANAKYSNEMFRQEKILAPLKQAEHN